MSSDAKAHRRSAAYAEFEDRKTGKNFFVVSVHLDDRHSSSLSTEGALDTLRAAQVRAVYNKVSNLAGSKPILFGGDINSWKTKVGSNAPFDVLTSERLRRRHRQPQPASALSTRPSTTGKGPSSRTAKLARSLSTS